MKRLYAGLIVALIAASVEAQPPKVAASYLAANVARCASDELLGNQFTVTDAASSASCVIGGGSVLLPCICNGTTFVPTVEAPDLSGYVTISSQNLELDWDSGTGETGSIWSEDSDSTAYLYQLIDGVSSVGELDVTTSADAGHAVLGASAAAASSNEFYMKAYNSAGVLKAYINGYIGATPQFTFDVDGGADELTITAAEFLGYATSEVNFSGPNGHLMSSASRTRIAHDTALILLNYAAAPSTAATACVAGTYDYDADYIYICVATNTWKRAALSTWP